MHRARLHILLYGGVLTALEVLLCLVAVRLAGDQPAWLLLVPALPVAALLGGSLAPGTWLGRHYPGLLRFAAAAVALALVLLAAVGLAVLLLGDLPDRREQAVVLPLLAGAAVAALLFAPVLRWTTSRGGWARRRGVVTAEDALRRFSEGAAEGLPLDELLLQLAEWLRRGLAVDAVEVWTGDSVKLRRTTSVPHREPLTASDADVEALSRVGIAGEAWVRTWAPRLLEGRADGQLRLATAVVSGQLLGLVVVERDVAAPSLAELEETVLAEVTRRLGVVLHNRQLDSALRATLLDLRRTNAELRASRMRLVAASDAERQRIERDIHDGAQQHLVALAVNLNLAQTMLTPDQQELGSLLDEIAQGVRATLSQVRDLAHGIYPPLLQEAGPVAALAALRTRFAVPVSVTADGERRVGADVETAVYFCCLEAVQNAVKHAPGSAVEVILTWTADELRFEVRDDGPGFEDSDAALGQGRQNMTDRLGAVGGSVSWTTGTGLGTVVRGSAPCRVGD